MIQRPKGHMLGPSHFAAALAFCFAFIHSGKASVVVVQQLVQLIALESEQQPHIVTKQNEGALGAVTLDVYRRSSYGCSPPTADAQFTLLTDAQGRARLPQLPPGMYYIVATAKPDLRQDLCLDITSLPASRPGEFFMDFAMDLQPPIPPPPTKTPEEMYEESIVNAENSRDIRVVPQFSGVLRDLTGAIIPRTAIDVFVKGTGGKERAAQLRTDEHGRFFADLPEGGYMAVFQARGFMPQIISVTISRKDGKGELEVKLQIAAIID